MLYHYFGNKQALYVATMFWKAVSHLAIRTAEHGLHLLRTRDPIEGITELGCGSPGIITLAHPEFLMPAEHREPA